MRRATRIAAACLLVLLSAPAAAQEAPAQRTPAEQTPALQTPTEQAPAEQTPAEQTPASAPPQDVNEQIMAVQLAYPRDPSSKLSEHLSMPSGTIELGAEMSLLTSDYPFGGERIEFTDVGLLHLRARRAMSDSVELFAATELLIKKPERADASVWQGALAGGEWAFSDDLALRVEANVGPVLDGGDGYLSAGPTLLTKQVIDRYARFELGLGYAFTGLDLVSPRDRAFYLHEAVAHAEAQLGERSAGFFLRLAYHFPFASGPDREQSPERYLDPTPQLNLQLGGVLIAGEHDDWDIYAVWALVDRGELSDRATTLPILDGGFDQQQWIFGVQHRFGADERRSP